MAIVDTNSKGGVTQCYKQRSYGEICRKKIYHMSNNKLGLNNGRQPLNGSDRCLEGQEEQFEMEEQWA